MQEIKIRKSTLRDLDTLVLQRHKMFEELRHRTPHEHKIGDETYRKWVVQMSRKRRFVGFLAVTDDGKPVAGGCVWIMETRPLPGSASSLRTPYLLSMYTEPPFRGKGLGTKIVKEAMRWAKDKGFATMTLHASEKGRRVYRKLGWVRTWEMRARLE